MHANTRQDDQPPAPQEAEVKVSIIVPVYNTAAYLNDCLNSLVEQTLPEIEIIVVDDCSTDGSAELVQKFERSDPRVKAIFHAHNMAAGQCRKDGMLKATGRYVMFVDGDDMLERTACEKLYARMERSQVDMIQFGTHVLAAPHVEPARVESVEKMLKPHKGMLRSRNMLDLCFVSRRFGFQIWNKIYRRTLCQQAFSHFPDGYFPKAQDLFAFYLLAYFARSYEGLVEEVYYIYRFGYGVTGQEFLSRASIERYAQQALVSDGLRAFIDKQQSWTRCYNSFQRCDDQLFRDAFVQVTKCAPKQDLSFACEMMCKYWGTDRFVSEIERTQFYNQGYWAKYLGGLAAFQAKPRQVKCIGTFYHRLSNGGAQRVMAMLATLWTEMGYQVIIFTDAPASAQDYPVAKGVIRKVLPSAEKDCRADRMQMIKRYIDMYQIDMFVYHAWVAPSLFWDMLAIKSMGVPFYVHTHNIFSMLFCSSIQSTLVKLADVYAMADGVLVLSKTDETYWQHFNSRVFRVTNPLHFDCARTPANTLSSKTVLWIGRIAKEKNPVQAVEVMSIVLKAVPDARMMFVGSGDANLERAAKQKCAEKGIEDSIQFCGFQEDVAPFYEQGDVFLMTSSYEGAPLTLAEAQAHGIPCVSYDMPYLSILENKRGCLIVDQHDVRGAAQAVIRLLEDEGLRKKIGAEAKQNACQMYNIDYRDMWYKIIHSAEEVRVDLIQDDMDKLMLKTMLQHYNAGYLSSGNQRTSAEKQLEVVLNTKSWKIGRAFTWLPRKIRLFLSGPQRAE